MLPEEMRWALEEAGVSRRHRLAIRALYSAGMAACFLWALVVVVVCAVGLGISEVARSLSGRRSSS